MAIRANRIRKRQWTSLLMVVLLAKFGFSNDHNEHEILVDFSDSPAASPHLDLETPVTGDPAPAQETPLRALHYSKHSATCAATCRHRTQVPLTIHKMLPPGNFAPPPSQGAGYYTLLDRILGRCETSRPKSGYAPFAVNAWPMFDADWRYVESVPYCQRDLVERLKRIHLTDNLLMSTGGEFWLRYANENNSRMGTQTNEYTLAHYRQHLDFWHGDSLRIFGEFVWADIYGEDLAPVPPDIDRGDILDLFADVRLFDLLDRPVFARVGRQELIYGSQRQISPLPWANRRNTFEGIRLFRQGECWDADLFWSQFVPPNANDFDRAESDFTLAGAWLTQRPRKGEFRDFYYVFFDNERAITQQAIPRHPSQTHTLGSRWAGTHGAMRWDIESALQFGDQAGQDLLASMFSVGAGRAWSKAPLQPVLWLYYDYASGDDSPNTGKARTYTPPFPFGHYYLGWLDAVGRQNMHDVNAHLHLYPSKWISVWLQYHHFWLDEKRDALYNAGGVAYRRDPTGNSGNNVGDEVDVVINFRLSSYSDILVSYSKLYGGSFLEATSGPNAAVDAESLYLIYQQRW